MLNIGLLAPGAGEYYIGEVASSAEDYYTGRGESAGRWVGSLAEEIGLKGEVDPDDFRAVLAGRDPQTGEQHVHRPGPRSSGVANVDPEREFDAIQAASVLDVSARHVRRLLEEGDRYLEQRGRADGEHDLPAPKGYLSGTRVAVKDQQGPEEWRVKGSELQRFAESRTERKFRPGYDLTLRPPKSVSVLWALGGPDIAGKVRDAHTRVMPFMFEREGDFTELLIPSNLLADDSVLNRSVKVLTEEVCEDVEVIGWLYQFYISERKDEVFAGFKKNKKAGVNEIPAATQLFTPHWIVRYLVENSLGRLWMLNHPASDLVKRMDYYIAPVDEETDFLKIASAEDLKVIDPACGSGHMLTYAFDLLYAIYEEEGYAPTDIPSLILANNLYGTEIDPRAGALAAFALTMKARAKQRTFFNKQVEPNICVIEPISFDAEELEFLAGEYGDPVQDGHFWNQFKDANILGSLIQPDPDEVDRLARHLQSLDDAGEMYRADAIGRARQVAKRAAFLAGQYDVVVANPPYMRSRNLSDHLGAFVKVHYPEGSGDLFAAFLQRCSQFASPGGMVGMVTMQSWLFLSGFEQLRRSLLRANSVVALAHLGTSAFETLAGEVVSTVACVLQASRGSGGVFTRLVDVPGAASKRAMLADPTARAEVSWVRDSAYFLGLPAASMVYWFDDMLRDLFDRHPPLSSMFSAVNGMTTGRNAMFVRYWFEVSACKTSFDANNEDGADECGARWFPYNKGGGGERRWYGNAEHVLDWENRGRRIQEFGHCFLRSRANYFRPMLTWSKINTGRPGFRFVPSGYLFDAAGMGIFPVVDGDDNRLLELLGYLNSTTVVRMLAGLSPTLNVESGQVGSIPLPDLSHIDREVVAALVSHQRDEWDSREVSWGFRSLDLLQRPTGEPLAAVVQRTIERRQQRQRTIASLETANDRNVDRALSEVPIPRDDGLDDNGGGPGVEGAPPAGEFVSDLVSYAVGCMFGRYSLDEPGLVLADQGATLQDYLAKVSAPTFTPDADNVIPIVDGDWFEDDIVARFRQFLRAAFGEQHFEENLRFVTKSLGVKSLRDYFVKSFYKDHVQRYKKRPIYWLFSSPKGSFNALIYMHRYTPSTVSTVLNEYLREFQAKLRASLEHAERSNNAKEADRLREVLLELDEYEHDVLYPLASQNIAIDLDDGVKANYPKFGAALKRIPGLEATE